ncbi:hypothetical protein ES705_41161 [subsurface metagenome]
MPNSKHLFRRLVDLVVKEELVNEGDTTFDYFRRIGLVNTSSKGLGSISFSFTKRGEKLRDMLLDIFKTNSDT